MTSVSTITDAEKVHRVVIDDGAFAGSAVTPLSVDHAVSFDAENRIAAVACGGGWMEIPFDVIHAIAAKTPR
jgi:hypothetical protein